MANTHTHVWELKCNKNAAFERHYCHKYFYYPHGNSTKWWWWWFATSAARQRHLYCQRATNYTIQSGPILGLCCLFAKIKGGFCGKCVTQLATTTTANNWRIKRAPRSTSSIIKVETWRTKFFSGYTKICQNYLCVLCYISEKKNFFFDVYGFSQPEYKTNFRCVCECCMLWHAEILILWVFFNSNQIIESIECIKLFFFVILGFWPARDPFSSTLQKDNFGVWSIKVIRARRASRDASSQWCAIMLSYVWCHYFVIHHVYEICRSSSYVLFCLLLWKN